MSRRVLLLTDERMIEHDPGPGHPERPERLRAIVDELKRNPLEGVDWAKPQAATREQIQRVHAANHIDHIDSIRGRAAQLDPDTSLSDQSVDAAYLAAGAAISAVERVANDLTTSAFALVRPPGHHAERDRAMGFCLFNNIAIAAEYAIAALGLQRVMIIDWDVHHGNGTQHTFESRSDVLVLNLHQHRLFPDTGDLHEVGIDNSIGYTVNVPLPPGLGDAVYIELFRRLVIPITDAYRPELILISAGFDAHRDDPLGGMNVTESGFAAMCAMVRDAANRLCSGRIAMMLEGGYHLAALSRSVRACVEVLAGGDAPSIKDSLEATAHTFVSSICAFHRQQWSNVI